MATISLLLSSVSAIGAFIAAIYSYRNLQEYRRLTRLSANYTRLNEAEGLLASEPSLMEMHGVSQEMLKECQATPAEVVYLLRSVRAGQEYSRIQGGEVHLLSRYRRHQFSNPKACRIWSKILKDRFVFASKFVRAVDEFIANGFVSHDEAVRNGVDEDDED